MYQVKQSSVNIGYTKEENSGPIFTHTCILEQVTIIKTEKQWAESGCNCKHLTKNINSVSKQVHLYKALGNIYTYEEK